MKKKSQKEINAEIAKLKEMKPNVLHFSMFGNDNWASIDACVRVLEEDLSEDDIDGDTEFEEADDLRGAALFAANWRDGYEKSPPSSDYEHLVQK